MRSGISFGIGNLVAASYLTLANMSCVKCVEADEAPGQPKFSSLVADVRHGIKDEKYRADATLKVTNDSSNPTGRIYITYSLCFDVPDGERVRKMCVDGGGDSITKLDSGKNWEKVAALKYRGATEINFGRMSVPLRGLDPHIALEVVVAGEPVYHRVHQLGAIGDYK